MKTVNTMVKLSLATALAIIATGCGGGGGSSSSNSEVSTSSSSVATAQSSSSSSSVASAPSKLTGKFVDSPVEGLTYQCLPSGIGGKTDTSGTIECQGTDTKFSVGLADVYLGYVPLTDDNFVATPFSLTMDAVTSGEASDYGFTEFVGSDFNSHVHYKGWDYAPVIAQLLQVLDSDGNPDNGITIDSEKEAIIATERVLIRDINEVDSKLKELFPTSYVSNDVATSNMVAYLDKNYNDFNLVPEQDNGLQVGDYYKLGNYSDKIIHNDKGTACKAYNKNGEFLGDKHGGFNLYNPVMFNIMGDGNVEEISAWTFPEGNKYDNLEAGISTKITEYQNLKGSYFRTSDKANFSEGWEVLPNSISYITLKPTDNHELISTVSGDIFVKSETPTSELGDNDIATMSCKAQGSTRYILVPTADVPDTYKYYEEKVNENVYQ